MTSLWLNYVFLIINYRERDNSDTNYVRIRIPNHNAKHCKSTLGKRAASNGELYIEFAENWCTHRDVWHEMFHTIGLFHEHQRSDRDEYVKFNQINLQDPSRLNNFNMYQYTLVLKSKYAFLNSGLLEVSLTILPLKDRMKM